MSIEVRPLGVKCNIQCQYCYQNPQRDAGNTSSPYDLEKMKAAIEKENAAFTIFGGEALMVPKSDLEELWSWGYEKYKRNAVQTNGVLIDDDHIEMFKKYKVGVGISIDGPGEMNDVRWAGSLEATREATAKTENNIEKLIENEIYPSLIITLHKCNATSDKLPQLGEWLVYMANIGVPSVRLHILETEDDQIHQKYALSVNENVEAFEYFAEINKQLKSLNIDVYRDMERLLMGDDKSVTCVWNACDAYTTRAVRGIEGHGQKSNCGRTNKDGIDFIKSDQEGFERYIALAHTPQDQGGCDGCDYFIFCKGQCPGTSIGRDWRNKSVYCDVWKRSFEIVEKELIKQGQQPVTQRQQVEEIKQYMVNSWLMGRNTTIEAYLNKQKLKETTTVQPYAHGDVPHGDHTDTKHG